MKTNRNNQGKFEYELGEKFSWLDIEMKCVIDRVDVCGCDNCIFNSNLFAWPKSECNIMACCGSERKDKTSCHFVRVKGGRK